MRSILFTFILCGLTSAFAAVEPYSVVVSDTTSYEVPPGKVFIIHAVSARQPAMGTPPTVTYFRFLKISDNTSAFFSFHVKASDSFADSVYVALSAPVHLKAGDRLVIPILAPYLEVWHFGLLIDEADLYAANIPTSLENPALVGNQFTADAKFASPRPRITKIETSTDLVNNGFLENPTAAEAPGITRDTSVVSIDTAGADKELVRVTAKARR